jgi:Cap4 dsDNA endonuclease
MTLSIDIMREEVESRLDDYLVDLEDPEKQEILQNKEQIITSLMAGELRDLGGLTAMRGFVYQYYVSMYYMISMIYPKHNSWWNSVILEYFDDITLISENKIRFIQVKTIKEGGSKNHQPNDFYKRKLLDKPLNKKDYFNSWVEKNILNYDYFLESTVIDGVDKSTISPQFEIVTNTKKSSLSSLDHYTGNIDFEIKDVVDIHGNVTKVINDNDKLKQAILKPIDGLNLKFEDYAKKTIDYYLRRLYINKLGSTRELYDDILDMIEETVLITDIRAKSVAEYIFKKMFQFVISNSHEDNEERLKKSELIVTELQIKHLVQEWVTEAKELISESSYYDSAWAIFNRALWELELEFQAEFANGNLKAELLTELQKVNEHITQSNRENSTYCVSILNKIFNGNNNLSMWDFEHGNAKSNLKESLRFIIYFMVFYDDNSEVYNNAKMLFHEGKSSLIDNILFTLYHARNSSNKVTSIEKIKLCLNECHIIRQITLDLYCLLIGTKKDSINQAAASIATMFSVTDTTNSLHKITDVPDNMRFVDAGEVEDFFEGFKKKEIVLDSFKQNELLPAWKKYLDEIVQKVRETYIEN